MTLAETISMAGTFLQCVGSLSIIAFDLYQMRTWRSKWADGVPTVPPRNTLIVWAVLWAVTCVLELTAWRIDPAVGGFYWGFIHAIFAIAFLLFWQIMREKWAGTFRP